MEISGIDLMERLRMDGLFIGTDEDFGYEY